jgi:hypothetical protein
MTDLKKETPMKKMLLGITILGLVFSFWPSPSRALDAYPDGRGNFIGFKADPNTGDVKIFKLSGSDGSLLWEKSHTIPVEVSATGWAVVRPKIDKNGDIISYGIGYDDNLKISKHKNSNGVNVWELDIMRDLNLIDVVNYDVDKNANIIVSGYDLGNNFLTIIKIKGTTGEIFWKKVMENAE